MNFDFNSYKSSVISLEESIDYILVLHNDYLCIGFLNREINIYNPEDFTLKINIKYDENNDNDKQYNLGLFLMELNNNKLLSIYDYSKLYIRKINYNDFTYETLQIIDNCNYYYLRKSIKSNHIYGINENTLSYIKNINEIISVLNLKNGMIEYFYEIPKKNVGEICIKTDLYYSSLLFFDTKKYKLINIIFNVNLYRTRRTQKDYCPFTYFDKYNLLGVFLAHDLIHFIDLENHEIKYKYSNTATSYPSIIYCHKLNDKKYFVVEYFKYCFGFGSSIYLSDLIPQNINCYEFSTNKIQKLETLNQTSVKFACFSNSLKYLVLQIEDNQIKLYSKK